MKKRERFLLILTLTFILVAGILYGPSLFKGRHGTIAQNITSSNQSSSIPDEYYMTSNIEGRIDFTSLDELKNDPFLLLKSKTESEVKIKLMGIFEREGKIFAIINNKVLAEGDEISGIKITKILANGVYIKKEEKSYFVPLHSEKTEEKFTNEEKKNE